MKFAMRGIINGRVSSHEAGEKKKKRNTAKYYKVGKVVQQS